MTNYNTVNELAERKAENKAAKYAKMAKQFVLKAQEIANENEDSFFIRMAVKEIVAAWRKTEQADCEYTAYANAHAAEIWLMEIMEIVNQSTTK